MPEYKKVGYLTTDFKMFHLKDEEMRSFHYHYHDFHKILILLNGDITYCIEGRSYQLAPNMREQKEWMKNMSCVKIELDGAADLEKNADIIVNNWKGIAR